MTVNGGLDIQGGTLEGTGTVVGTVTNTGGTVNPGASAGLLSHTGTYMQGPGGILTVEIGGTNAAAFDRFVSTGTSTLDGTINAVLIDSFEPSVGDSFIVYQSSSRSGTFPGLNTAISDGGMELQVAYTDTSVVLHAVQAPTTLWTGAGDGFSWTDPANWSDGVPDSTDVTRISADGTYSVQLNATTKVRALHVGGGAGIQTLDLTGGTLTLLTRSTVKGALNVSGATIQVLPEISLRDQLVVSGALSLADGSVLDLSDQLSDQFSILGRVMPGGAVMVDASTISGGDVLLVQGTLGFQGGNNELDALVFGDTGSLLEANTVGTSVNVNQIVGWGGSFQVGDVYFGLSDQLSDQLSRTSPRSPAATHESDTRTGSVMRLGHGLAPRRRPLRERVVPARPRHVLQNPVHHPRLRDHRHHHHLHFAPRAHQRIHLQNPPQQPRPAPPSRPRTPPGPVTIRPGVRLHLHRRLASPLRTPPPPLPHLP